MLEANEVLGKLPRSFMAKILTNNEEVIPGIFLLLVIL